MLGWVLSCVAHSVDWKQRDTIFDQRGGWLKQKPFLLKAAGNPFRSMGSLFVCLGLFRGEWLHLFRAASICNLVCLSSESLAWGKQWHAPHVLEDHCVNGPRSVCSEWRSLNTDTSCWTHQHELSEISERQPGSNRSKSELYQGKQWIVTLEWITIRKTMIWWWKCWFIGYVYYIRLLHYLY